MQEEASKAVGVVVCTKSITAQTGQGNWKLKSLNLGKDSLGDPLSEAGGRRKKMEKEKRPGMWLSSGTSESTTLPPFSLVDCVVLGKILKLSETQFPRFKVSSW